MRTFPTIQGFKHNRLDTRMITFMISEFFPRQLMCPRASKKEEKSTSPKHVFEYLNSSFRLIVSWRMELSIWMSSNIWTELKLSRVPKILWRLYQHFETNHVSLSDIINTDTMQLHNSFHIQFCQLIQGSTCMNTQEMCRLSQPIHYHLSTISTFSYPKARPTQNLW